MQAGGALLPGRGEWKSASGTRWGCTDVGREAPSPAAGFLIPSGASCQGMLHIRVLSVWPLQGSAAAVLELCAGAQACRILCQVLCFIPP